MTYLITREIGHVLTICILTIQGDCTCKEAESMDVKAQVRDPRDHVNEEPRNDLGDLLNGFFGMATLMTVIFFGMVIVKFIFSE